MESADKIVRILIINGILTNHPGLIGLINLVYNR